MLTMNEQRKTAGYLAGAYLLGLVVISLMPTGGLNISLESVKVVSLRADYLLHALAFIPFFGLWKWRWPHHPWWAVVLIGLLVAAASEGSHYVIPYRSYNVNDLIANMLGVSIGALLFGAWAARSTVRK